MLQPKRTKFRKQMKGRNRGLAQRGSKVSFGEYALKAVGRGRYNCTPNRSCSSAMTRHVKRGGKIWIRIFPDKPITKKPLEVRQGKGKGSVEYWVPRFSQVVSCTKWKAYLKSWLVKPLLWPPPSCL